MEIQLILVTQVINGNITVKKFRCYHQCLLYKHYRQHVKKTYVECSAKKKATVSKQLY